MQHMPNGDEHLSCHSHQNLHLVLFPHLRLMVREPAEEAVLRPAGCPCTLYDCLAEMFISVFYPNWLIIRKFYLNLPCHIRVLLVYFCNTKISEFPDICKHWVIYCYPMTYFAISLSYDEKGLVIMKNVPIQWDVQP